MKFCRPNVTCLLCFINFREYKCTNKAPCLFLLKFICKYSINLLEDRSFEKCEHFTGNQEKSRAPPYDMTSVITRRQRSWSFLSLINL